MSPPLSPETERRLLILFPPDTRAEAVRLLVEQCGNNLPLLEKLNQFELERARFSALKLSQGSIEKLKKAIELAKLDWRDLYVSAGFGQLNAHHAWEPKETDK